MAKEITANQELAIKLLKVQEELPKIGKDANNPYFSSSYLTLEKLLDKLLPILQSKGLLLSQTVTYMTNGESVEPVLNTEIFDTQNGASVDSKMLLMSKAKDPQAQGSAITYARRYALMAIFGIVPAETDDDGNMASPAPIEKAMSQTQWLELGKLLDEKGINSREDKITLIRALAGDKPLNTSAFERLKKEITNTNADTLQQVLIESL